MGHGTELGYLERKELKEQVLTLTKREDWPGVLKFYESNPDFHEPLLVWIRPSRAALAFIEEVLRSRFGLDSILSIGCGCGFLEWLLSRATRLWVTGLEVNQGWWACPHATPTMIPVAFTEPGIVPEIPTTVALMFCYFNNLEYFYQYLEHYSGSCLILIGPTDGKRHCAPEPMELEHSAHWELLDSFLISGLNLDTIAIYTKRDSVVPD